ncbi:GGDEF domain-containing protein [Alkalilimnicola ehrlichii]|nr:GGDEF domain-containing protein [Alkalilimnicola ehrlichii]
MSTTPPEPPLNAIAELLKQRDQASSALANIDRALHLELTRAAATGTDAISPTALLRQLVIQPDVANGVLTATDALASAFPHTQGTLGLRSAQGSTRIAGAWRLGQSGTHLLKDSGTSLAPPSLTVPLNGYSIDIGELRLWSVEQQTQTLPEQATIHAFAVAIEAGLGGLILKERLAGDSARDPLTGLFNRRYMEDTLDRELHRAVRKQLELGLILLDIDRFRPFNERYGLPAGDQVLRALGGLIQASFRGSDVCCRYSGQQFVVILPEAPLADTLRRAQQLQVLVRELDLRYEGRTLPRISLAVGIAHFPRHAAKGDNLLAAAESALYRAKQHGPNHVMIAEKYE